MESSPHRPFRRFVRLVCWPMAEALASGMAVPTLLQSLMRERRLTHEQTIAVLDRRARDMGMRDFALSTRQLARWLAGRVATAPHPSTIRVVEAEFGDAIERLLGPATGQPFKERWRHEATTTVSHFDAILNHLAQIDHLQGARASLEPAIAVFASVSAAARQARGPDRASALSAAARCSELVGWFFQDADMPGRAHEWTVRALDLVEEANDQSLLPYVLMRRSAVAAELGQADDALLLAERATRLSRDGIERALAMREVATAHALKGDRARMRDAIDGAIACLDGPASGSGVAPYCNLPYVLGEAGAAAIQANAPELGVQFLESAVNSWVGAPSRDRELCNVRLSLAHAQVGEIDAAAEIAAEAAKAAPNHGSSRFTRTLRSTIDIISSTAGPDRSASIVESLRSIA